MRERMRAWRPKPAPTGRRGTRFFLVFVVLELSLFFIVPSVSPGTATAKAATAGGGFSKVAEPQKVLITVRFRPEEGTPHAQALTCAQIMLTRVEAMSQTLKEWYGHPGLEIIYLHAYGEGINTPEKFANLMVERGGDTILAYAGVVPPSAPENRRRAIAEEVERRKADGRGVHPDRVWFFLGGGSICNLRGEVRNPVRDENGNVVYHPEYELYRGIRVEIGYGHNRIVCGNGLEVMDGLDSDFLSYPFVAINCMGCNTVGPQSAPYKVPAPGGHGWLNCNGTETFLEYGWDFIAALERGSPKMREKGAVYTATSGGLESDGLFAPGYLRDGTVTVQRALTEQNLPVMLFDRAKWYFVDYTKGCYGTNTYGGFPEVFRPKPKYDENGNLLRTYDYILVDRPDWRWTLSFYRPPLPYPYSHMGDDLSERNDPEYLANKQWLEEVWGPTVRGYAHSRDYFVSSLDELLDDPSRIYLHDGFFMVGRKTALDISLREFWGVEGEPNIPPTPLAVSPWFEGYAHEYVLLSNPNDQPTKARLRVYDASGEVGFIERTIPARSRDTVKVNSYLTAACDDAGRRSVSVLVESDLPLAVERAQYFLPEARLGVAEATCSGALPEPSTRYWFADGCGRAGWETYYCVLNPNDSQASLAFRFMDQDGRTWTQDFAVPPKTRFTLRGAEGADYSCVLESSLPVYAERAMYCRPASGGLFRAAGAEAGLTSLSRLWRFAEGHANVGAAHFATFVLVQNPGEEANRVKVRVLPDASSGLPPYEQEFSMSPHQRLTWCPPLPPGRTALDFAVEVEAEREVACEMTLVNLRPLGGASQMAGVPDSRGFPGPSDPAVFAEGAEVPGSLDTYLLLANFDPSQEAEVEVSWLLSGAAPVVRTHRIAPRSRLTVRAAHDLGLGPSDRAFFGISVRPLSGKVLATRSLLVSDYAGVRGLHGANPTRVSALSTQNCLAEGYAGL